MIFIISFGEIFLLLFHCQFFFSTFHYIKKKKTGQCCRIVVGACPVLLQEFMFQWDRVLNQG